MSKRIAVYCASSTKVSQDYFDQAKKIAGLLADNGHHIVYGGGAVGLMGAVADMVIKREGLITGVIPEFMKQVEWDHPGVKDMIVTKTMAERKEIMLEHADIALALPGGSGTYEEIFEAITLKRLGVIATDIIFYNQNGFYDPMKAMFDKAVSEQFMTPDHIKQINFFEQIGPLIEFINTSQNADLLDINAAVVR